MNINILKNTIKKIAGLIVASAMIQFAFISPAPAIAAQGCPLNTFYGTVTVNGIATDNATVTLTDITNGSPALSVVTSLGGFYQIDTSNLNICAVAGDQIQLNATFGAFSTNVTRAFVVEPLTNINLAISSIATTHNIVSVASTAGGTIAPAGTTPVNSGASQSYIITPNIGYHIANVLVDGTSVGAVSTYTFNNVTTTHTINASFAINTYNITSSAGANGTISPLGVTSVNHGTSLAYTITPNINFAVADVLVDGVSVGAVTTYTFTNIAAAHSIDVSFTGVPIITPVPQQNGTVGQIVTFDVVATNPNQGMLMYSLDANAPVGSSIDAMGTFSWIPSIAGTYNFNVIVDDMASAPVSSPVTIIVVVAPVLTSINVAPVNSSVVVGSTQQMTATTLDQNGAPIAATVAWTSSNLAVGTIDSVTGMFTAVSAGTTTVTATSGAVSGMRVVTVTASGVFYTAADVATHNTQASCWSIVNNTVYDLTNFIPLHSGGPALIISICGTDGTTLFNSGPHAAATIDALSPYIIGSLAAAPVLSSINVAPVNSSVVVGSTQQMTATTLDQNGAPIAATVAWTSSNLAVGTIDSVTGMFTAVSAGTTTVTATSGAVSGMTMVTVTAVPVVPVLSSINVAPVNSSVVVGSTQQMTATTLDQNGAPIAATVAWTSSTPATGTINSATGMFTAVAVGTTTITATSGAVSGMTVVTVNVQPVVVVPVLTTINVTPTNPSVTVAGTQQFTATTLDQNGSPITATVAWTSSNLAVGTINAATGMFTAVSAGTTTVTATSGAVSGMTLVTVNAVPHSSSGGGSSFIRSLIGQVLGVSTGPVPGCGNRTTGFSVATGQSCAGNTGIEEGPIPGCGNRTTGFSVVTGQSCIGNPGTVGQVLGQVLGAGKHLFTLLNKEGSEGEEVEELQKFLNQVGYFLIIDRKFGKKTKEAVVKLQIVNGLKGDGIVGPLTRAILNK